MAADKAKEQELKSRTREVITTKQEQVHVTHEQVKKVGFDVNYCCRSCVSTHNNVYCEGFCFLGNIAVTKLIFIIPLVSVYSWLPDTKVP